jgi:hypothetical protein
MSLSPQSSRSKSSSSGIVSCEGGVDSGKAPSRIRDDQIAWGVNVTNRGGEISQRPGFRQIKLSGSVVSAMVRGHFQGASFFEDAGGRGYLIASSGGSTYRIRLTGNSADVIDITPAGDKNSDQSPIVYHQQAETALIVQDGVSLPLIYDGANSRRAEADEVPIGSGPMAYGMGRLWVARGYEYVAGDISGGPTGVTKFTENEYLNEGGSFTVPLRLGGITAMQFTASPNTALGQGELFIATPDAAYSTVVPTDRDAWKNLQDPVQRVVLINNGSQSHAATVLVNGDVYIRSRDGIRSVIQAVRDFSQAGNVPISREMSRAMNDDDPTLLKFTSGILFDNRLLMTTQARSIWNGAYFNGIASLDFDLISSTGNRLPPAWDGVWSGLQFLFLTKGRFNGVERAFAFVRNPAKGFVKQVIVRTGEQTGSLTGAVTASSPGGATYSTRYRVSTNTINDPGFAYEVGDVITMDGPTSGLVRQASWLVTTIDGSGEVTGATLINPGDYGVDITAASYATTTTGAGTGCRVAVGSFAFALTVTNGGSNYTSAPAITASFNSGDPCTEFDAVAVMDYEWELWEITKDLKFDRPLGAGDVPFNRRITSVVESKSWHFAVPNLSLARDTKKLMGAEIWVDGVMGTVDYEIEYRPNQHPCWVPWKSWQFCALFEDCGPSANCQPKTYLPQSRPRSWIPEPAQTPDANNVQLLNLGREFQVRLTWTGPSKLKMLEVVTESQAESVAPPCVPTTESCVGLECPCPN